MYTSTMTPKDASSSKQVAKKGNKKALFQSSTSTESSSSSGDLVEIPMKGKAETKDQRKDWGKKLVTQEDTTPIGHRKKNPHTSSTRRLSQFKKGSMNGAEELSLDEVSSENANMEEVDANLNNRNDPPLSITPSLMPIV